MKHDHPDAFICPYCAGVQTYEPSAVPDNGGRLNCNQCNKTFMAWVETDVVFYTRDLEGGVMLKNFLDNKEPTNGSI